MHCQATNEKPAITEHPIGRATTAPKKPPRTLSHLRRRSAAILLALTEISLSYMAWALRHRARIRRHSACSDGEESVGQSSSEAVPPRARALVLPSSAVTLCRCVACYCAAVQV